MICHDCVHPWFANEHGDLAGGADNYQVSRPQFLNRHLNLFPIDHHPRIPDRVLQHRADGAARALGGIFLQQLDTAQDIDDFERSQGLTHENPEQQGGSKKLIVRVARKLDARSSSAPMPPPTKSSVTPTPTAPTSL